MFKVDNGKLLKLNDANFCDIRIDGSSIKERYDIQEWIAANPEVISTDCNEDPLLIIDKEHAFEGKSAGKGIRADLLALDTEGKLVVIELKRDDSGDGVDWQAIKYAARLSRYSPDKITQLLMKYKNNISEEAAKDTIINYIGGFKTKDQPYDDLFYKTDFGLYVRIVLVARKFNPDVCASVLWLRESGIDISCIRLKPFQYDFNDDNNVFKSFIFLDSEMIIPLPETKAYTEFKKENSNKTNGIEMNASRQSSYSSEIPELNDNELKEKIISTFNNIKGDQIPRLKVFLDILCKEQGPITQDAMKQKLFDKKIGEDIGRSGAYLSNISTFITNKNSGFLRQLLEYDIEGGGEARPGARKTNYRVNEKYRELLQSVLNTINQQQANENEFFKTMSTDETEAFSRA